MAVEYTYVKGEGWVPKHVLEIKCYKCPTCGIEQSYPIHYHTRHSWDMIPVLCGGKMTPVYL